MSEIYDGLDVLQSKGRLGLLCRGFTAYGASVLYRYKTINATIALGSKQGVIEDWELISLPWFH